MNLFLPLVLLGNLWIWRIFNFSFILGLLVLTSSIFLYLTQIGKNKKYSLIFLFLLAGLILFQWTITERVSLISLSNDEQRVIQMKLKEYPTSLLRVGHWFEERPESIGFFRILNNFSEAIDLNLYFFANHPRERVGAFEFEKFPYLLLPFFIFGTLLLVKKGMNKEFILSSFGPILILSCIGSRSPLGPFSLFPFVAITTIIGLENVYEKLKSLAAGSKRTILLGFLAIYLLVFIQITLYALN